MAASLYRTAGFVVKNYSANAKNIFARRRIYPRYDSCLFSTQQVVHQELNRKPESLDSITEKLRNNKISAIEAVNIFNTIQTYVTKAELVKLESESGFKNVCDIVGKGCTSFNNNTLINCTKNILGLGLPPETYVVKSLETEILWRLRKFNLRQLAHLLSIHVEYQNDEMQIKVVREIIQTIQRRWVEIDSIREVCTLLAMREKFNEDFLQRLEDRAIESMEKSSVEDMTRLFVQLANIKRRPPSVLRSLAFHLSRQTQKLLPKQVTNIVCAMSSLSFPDQVLLQRLTSDFIPEIASIEKSNAIAAVLTSIGLLRWKHFELLDELSGWILKNIDKCRPQDLVSYAITTAKLNYTPHEKEEIFKLLISRLDEKSVSLPNVWVDVVWSFVVHGKANETHFKSVLNSNFYHKLTNVNSKLKLAYIDSAAKYENPKYEGPFLSDEVTKDLLIPQSKEMQRLGLAVTETLSNFIPKGKFMSTNKIIADCIFVDAEFVVDSKAKPHPLQDSKNPLPTGLNKVCLIVRHFKDFTIHTVGLTGSSALMRRLLGKMKYTVVDIPFMDFSMQGTTLQKVQYLQKKISEEVTTNKQTPTESSL